MCLTGGFPCRNGTLSVKGTLTDTAPGTERYAVSGSFDEVVLPAMLT